MAKRTKKPKNVLKLPDLDYSKSAVLNTLPSLNSRRSYEHAIRDFVEWYCSEPRLAFNKTVVTRYRIALEQRGYAPSTINLRLAADQNPLAIRGGLTLPAPHTRRRAARRTRDQAASRMVKVRKGDSS
ncbi:MAG TPA: hypothetical protein VMU57_03110 [Edaphobacter sp.]|nr:hypothetical protein [Edaphobacter sp.]HUZ93878.1 hypothetical protein [Edaphobacter sp.]